MSFDERMSESAIIIKWNRFRCPMLCRIRYGCAAIRCRVRLPFRGLLETAQILGSNAGLPLLLGVRGHIEAGRNCRHRSDLCRIFGATVAFVDRTRSNRCRRRGKSHKTNCTAGTRLVLFLAAYIYYKSKNSIQAL